MVVLAPTAGGKTEAAALPLASLILRRNLPPVSALWLSPLRALLNNQERRLQLLTGMVGLSAFKWHGDVPQAQRQNFLRDPAHMLMITPESLEGIFMNARVDESELLGGLRFIVVDEVHAFAGDDRGDHLCALLERVAHVAGRDLQRIGLSATVGNPESILEWLRGSSQRHGLVVKPESAKTRRQVDVHPVDELAEAGRLAAQLAAGHKSLLFAQSRNKVESIREYLEQAGITTFVHHGSLSRAVREDSERAFREGGNCCICCTSTLELGLDVGDLDLILQLDAPSTVSSMLQRWGRAARRPGATARMVFLVDREWSFLRAVALLRLGIRGFIEPVQPSQHAAHIYLHQVLTRIVASAGVSYRELEQSVGTPYAFRELDLSSRRELLDHLVMMEVLTSADSLLVLGPVGEKVFGRGHFRELYAVFESPRELRVRTTQNQEIGTLEVWFAQSLGEPFCITLAGKAWISVECDWERGILTVKPAPRGKVPTWMGSPVLLGRELCEEIRDLLIGHDSPPFLKTHGQQTLAELRGRWRDLLRRGQVVLERQGESWKLYTFLGGRVNHVLGLHIRELLGVEPTTDNFTVSWRSVPLIWSALQDRLRSHAPIDLSKLSRGRLSKFQPYLPAALEQRFLTERLLDIEGAAEVAELDFQQV